jgi:outer membrane protein assembly factor BamD (BamD/ComL family)
LNSELRAIPLARFLRYTVDMKRQVVYGLALLVLGVLVVGCASVKVSVDGDIAADELVQRGQEASDRYQYRLALEYYELVLERFAYNIDMVITARYEIAYINFKQKKYAVARKKLVELLVVYEDIDAETYPQQFKRLCEVVIQLIDKKTGAAAGPTAAG